MAKAKYKKNYRGEFEARIWDGTYNADGSKHRKRLVSKKSSADLERQVNQLKEGVKLSDIRNSHFQQAIHNALDKPRTCQQIYITFKQIVKMAVTDNYIGSGMYIMICSDISLPKYIRKEKRARNKTYAKNR